MNVMTSASQSILRNNGGGAGGLGGFWAFAGGVLPFPGAAAGGVLAGAAPEDGCFLSFGTFGLSIKCVQLSKLVLRWGLVLCCHSTQFIRPGVKGLILEVIPLRFVHSKLAGEIPFRPAGRLSSGRRFV